MARDESRVTGWWVFAAALLLIASVLNIVWGIGAIGNAHFFDGKTDFLVSNLKTWGWISLILGILQGFAAFSLAQGGGFGRWFGLFSAVLVSINSLMTISAYPFWSLCLFALSIIILYELAAAPQRYGVE
jgi:hypothetical protein